ncbi:FAD-binding oxidoreductase [Pedococcus sp. 5OH_020]|uniref:FAD-binding oxidoreductase n=1 Tax=Pedococcus sp. 5OH_020 TaxID=2989814 RepID=UPI0022E9E941|nr:FAD-binding oxidoreductase [Pedococcus sp. 5OH_020]
MNTGTQRLSGWGRANTSPALVSHEESTAAVAALVRSAAAGGLPRGILARGLGRSYGDAALNAGGRVVRTDRLTAIGDVQPDGTVEVGSGVSIAELLRHVVPRGWFVPVTPGTGHVTLGGAVAADVHGKNHHREGSVGRHVVRLQLVDGTGEVRTVSPGDPAYGAVVGGMGLSGIVTKVTLRLRPISSATLTVRTTRTADLDATMSALQEADRTHRYTVAWLDTLAKGSGLGRAVLTAGDHTTSGEAPRGGVPVGGGHSTAGEPASSIAYSPGRSLPAPPWVPSALLSPTTMRAFNEAYFRAAPARPRVTTESIASFFHPLDVVRGWNRMYGRPGFLQHQFAVADPQCLRAVLELFSRERVPGFLAVLKRFGPSSGLPLSFPTAGWTLATDVPASPQLGPVLDRADELVASYGGRLYLAKDSRMRPELLPAMYPDLDHWRQERALLDPHHLFVSDLSRRLHLC